VEPLYLIAETSGVEMASRKVKPGGFKDGNLPQGKFNRKKPISKAQKEEERNRRKKLPGYLLDEHKTMPMTISHVSNKGTVDNSSEEAITEATASSEGRDQVQNSKKDGCNEDEILHKGLKIRIRKLDDQFSKEVSTFSWIKLCNNLKLLAVDVRTAVAESKRSNESQNGLTMDLVNSLFLLIQHSLQSGPLKGSKPGYFKRSSPRVNGFVYGKYLPGLFGETIECSDYCFSENQSKAIKSWFKRVQVQCQKKQQSIKRLSK